MIFAISGATGFIGLLLTKRCIEKGHQVRVLTRDPRKIPAGLNVQVFQGDITDAHLDLNPFFTGVDVFFHCAAEIKDPAKMREINVRGTQRLIAGATGKIKRWVQLSSVGCYGPHRSGTVTEESPLNPVNEYEITKTEADRLVMEAGADGAFSFTLLRPSNVFGAGMRNRSLSQLITQIARGRFFLIGKRKSLATYIHVENVVQALILCAVRPEASGEIFILSDQVAWADFIRFVTTRLGRKAPGLVLPERSLRAATRILDFIPRSPLTTSRIDALTNRTVYSSDKIVKLLQYKHEVSIEQGIVDIVDEWKRQG